MMKVIKSTELTLDKVFAGKSKDVDFKDKDFNESEEIEKTKKTLKTKLKGIPWFFLANLLKKHLMGVLNVNILDILQQGWRKMGIPKNPKEKNNKDKTNTNEGFEQALASHSINFEYYPFMSIQFQGKALTKLKLRVVGKIALKGAKLRVINGKLKRVKSSESSGSISIRFNNTILFSKTLNEIPLLKIVDVVDKKEKDNSNDQTVILTEVKSEPIKSGAQK